MSGDDVDYGYGDMGYEDMGYGDDAAQYGYGDDGQDMGYEDMGYGDQAGQENANKDDQAKAAEGDAKKGRGRQRRNSCVIRKDQDPLAVADFLMGGPPKDGEKAV